MSGSLKYQPSSATEAPEPLVPLLMRRAREAPDRMFLQDVGGAELTYGQTEQQIRRWAGALEQLGVAPGVRVAGMVDQCAATVPMWLGINVLEALYTPIHPSFIGDIMAYAITQVGCAVIVMDRRFVGLLADISSDLPSLRTVVVIGGIDGIPFLPFTVIDAAELLNQAPLRSDTGRLQPWNLAAITYTSGTTGPSKPVLLPWAQLGANALRMFPYDDLSEDDCIYSFTPSSHIGAFVFPYLAALLGGRILFRASFRTQDFLSDVRRFGCTTVVIGGAITNFILQQQPAPDDAQIALRHVGVSAGSPQVDTFRERFGVRICTIYSSSELSAPITSGSWDLPDWRSCGSLTAGFPQYEGRLVDENDNEVPIGSVGELVVRTGAPWTITPGYFDMPEETANAWRNGWFHTGDAFTTDPDGSFYFVDRMKDTIRRRGENISSFEIEATIRKHPDVQNCAVIAVSSELGEDEVKAVIVLRANTSLSPQELIDFLTERAPKFMVPRYVEYVEEIPVTEGTERVRKDQLRKNPLNADTWDRERSRQIDAGAARRV